MQLDQCTLRSSRIAVFGFVDLGPDVLFRVIRASVRLPIGYSVPITITMASALTPPALAARNALDFTPADCVVIASLSSFPQANKLRMVWAWKDNHGRRGSLERRSARRSRGPCCGGGFGGLRRGGRSRYFTSLRFFRRRGTCSISFELSQSSR